MYFAPVPGEGSGFILVFFPQSCSVVICCKGVKGSFLYLSIQRYYIELLNVTASMRTEQILFFLVYLVMAHLHL